VPEASDQRDQSREAAIGRRRGIAAVTVKTTSAGLLTGVKVTSYATALAAVAQAEKSGADDAIYLGEHETVLEATMSNVWWREGDVLVTPSLSTGVLPGVTRGAVAAIARTAGYRVQEGSFTLPHLLRAEAQRVAGRRTILQLDPSGRDHRIVRPHLVLVIGHRGHLAAGAYPCSSRVGV